MSTRTLGSICGCLFLFFALGCMKKTEPDLRILWPPPPDQPRLEFIGNFQSAADFPDNKGWLEKWLIEVTGGIERAGALLNPQDIAVYDNRAYISDPALKNIVIFDFNDASISSLLNSDQQAGMLKAPLGLTMNPQGEIFVIDGAQKAVCVFSTDGRQLHEFRDQSRFRNPTDIAIDPATGRIYISDAVTHKITVYDKSGNHLFDIGRPGVVHGQFKAPSGLAFDNRNRLYVTDTDNARIQVFDPNGNYLKSIGESEGSRSSLTKPVDIALDHEGYLYVLDQGALALFTFSEEGEVLLVTGSGKESSGKLGLANPTSIFIDDQNRIYITDTRNHRFNVWQILSTDQLAGNPTLDESGTRIEAIHRTPQEDIARPGP